MNRATVKVAVGKCLVSNPTSVEQIGVAVLVAGDRRPRRRRVDRSCGVARWFRVEVDRGSPAAEIAFGARVLVDGAKADARSAPGPPSVARVRRCGRQRAVSKPSGPARILRITLPFPPPPWSWARTPGAGSSARAHHSDRRTDVWYALLMYALRSGRSRDEGCNQCAPVAAAHALDASDRAGRVETKIGKARKVEQAEESHRIDQDLRRCRRHQPRPVNGMAIMNI